MPTPLRPSPLGRTLAALWLTAFLLVAFQGATVSPPPNLALFALAAAGAVWCAVFARGQLREFVREHQAVLATALLLAAAILWSEATARWRGDAPAHALPPQFGLLLCLPSLALLLRDETVLRGVVLVFAAFCLYHFVAMPLEAVTGAKVSWHPIELLARDAGPFHYQASGLARQSYFFPGLFLPLFWLAWGPVYERRLFGSPVLPRAVGAALPLLWLVTAASVQSRSAFAGQLAAALLAIGAGTRVSRRRAWLGLALLLAVAAGAYWAMFAHNKSGPGLRLAYLELYLRAALDPHWLWTGRSFSLQPDPAMVVPGLQPLQHSHNDVAQVFYAWGLPGLLAYAAFWVALLRLVVTRFVRRGEYWPACALVALAPNLVTDVGFQHYEKAVFLVLLAALCTALPPRPRPHAGAAAAGSLRP